MAYGAFTHCGLFVNGLDLTSDSNMAKILATKEVKDRNVFGFTAKNRVMAGLSDIKLTAAGFVNNAAGGQLESFQTNLYSDTINTCLIIPSASGVAPAVGDSCWFFQGMQAQHELGDQHGNDLAWNLSLQGGANGYPLSFGKCLNPGTTAITADASGTGVEVGAVSASQYAYAMLNVTEVSLDDSIIVTIYSAAANDFVGETLRFTFASKAAVGSEYLAKLVGPITDTWWRAKYDVTGAAGVSIKCAVSMAIQ